MLKDHQNQDIPDYYHPRIYGFDYFFENICPRRSNKNTRKGKRKRIISKPRSLCNPQNDNTNKRRKLNDNTIRKGQHKEIIVICDTSDDETDDDETSDIIHILQNELIGTIYDLLYRIWEF